MTLHISKRAVAIAGTLVALAGLLVGAYFLGKSSVDEQAVRAAGFTAGTKAGAAQAAVRAREAEAGAFKRGGEAALGPLIGEGALRTGRYYIVSFRRGFAGFDVPFMVDETYTVAKDTDYSLCAAGDGICESKRD